LLVVGFGSMSSKTTLSTANETSGYERLEVFQRSMSLISQVRKLNDRLPASERYELANQMTRASRSVPTNIAEGYGRRRSAKEFNRFLTIAMASANEMVHLRIAGDLYADRAEEALVLQSEYRIVGKQLNRLIASWRNGAPRSAEALASTSEPTTHDQQPTTNRRRD
jgi:four helix bundle protein